MRAFKLLKEVPRKALVFGGGPLYFGFMSKQPEAQLQELERMSIEARALAG
jgi:hypothetical protein